MLYLNCRQKRLPWKNEGKSTAAFTLLKYPRREWAPDCQAQLGDIQNLATGAIPASK